jgi:Zn-dependent protease/CBS domain-containing protein
MFGHRMRLFRLFGIPLSVDASWLIVAALVTLTLHERFHIVQPSLPNPDLWLMAVVAALCFFACIVLHEFGHALAGRAQGIPFRGITLFLFGGVAELNGEPPSAKSEFIMAAAGPLVSLVLGVAFWVLAELGQQSGWPAQVWLVLDYLGLINLTVLVFNLVPAFPLDGGRILRSVLWGWTGNLRKATRWAAALGRGFGWLLIALGVMSFFAGDWVSGVWLGLIGMFLANAAQASYQQVVIRQALQGEPVARFMNTQPIVVPPTTDLRSWVEDYVYRHNRKAFPVASDGHLEGIVTTQALARFPREEWDRHTVAEAMQSELNGLRVAPQTDALDALERMQRSGSSRLLVMDGDRLVGIISLKDLLRFLNLKLELEPSAE